MSQTNNNPDNVLYNVYVSYPPNGDPTSINSKIRSAMANKDTASEVIRELSAGKNPLVSENQPAEKIQQLKEYFAYMGLDTESVAITQSSAPNTEEILENIELDEDVEWVAEESFDFIGDDDFLSEINETPQTSGNPIEHQPIQDLNMEDIVIDDIIETSPDSEQNDEEIHQDEDEYQDNEVASEREYHDEYIADIAEYREVEEPEEEYEEEEYDYDEDEYYDLDDAPRNRTSQFVTIGIAVVLLLAVGVYFIYTSFMDDLSTPTASQKVQETKQLAENKPSATPKTVAIASNTSTEALSITPDSNDSLVYLSTVHRLPKAHNSSSFYLFALSLNPENRGIGSPLMDLPNPLKIRLLPEFIDTLLSFGQIDRANEVLEYAAKTNNEFAQSAHFGTAKAHVLAYQVATHAVKAEQLNNHIAALPEISKIEAMIYAANIYAKNGLSATQWLSDAEKQIAKVDNKIEKQNLNNLLDINKAVVLSHQNKASVQRGLWSHAQQYDQQLQKMRSTASAPVAQFAIALTSLRTAGLMNDSKNYLDSQKTLMQSVDKLSGLQDNQVALRFWHEYIDYLPAEFNQNLVKKMQPVVKEQLPMAEEAITLYQVCRALNNRDCYVKISERAFGNPRLTAKLVEDFGLQIYVYNILTAAKQSYHKQDFIQSEEWLRRAAEELL